MTIGIIEATTDGQTLRLELCDAFVDGQCACPEKTAHPEYRFGAEPPAGFAGTAEEWAEACALEALRLEQGASPSEPEPVPALAGMTL
jgi:hypothetical protein